MTTYLCDVLDKPVWNAQGQRIGRCLDLLVTEVERGFPPLRALAVRRGGEDLLVPADEVAWLSPSVLLNSTDPPTYTPQGDELWLRRQVLDRQIVDVEGRRLVRVNDLQLARRGRESRYRLVGANVGTLGLARRLGMAAPLERVFNTLQRDVPDRVIPWNDVAPVQAEAPIRLRVTRDKISEIHPVDLANIVSDLDLASGRALLETLDDEVMADTMSEIDPGLQSAMLTALPPERAAEVLEEMDPDDAADLLATLEEEDRAALLDLMEEEDADDVGLLLTYPVDSAGGIMTTEFATAPLSLTAGEALGYLRSSPEAREDEALYYVHVVDDEGRLQGVVALRDLVMADPAARLPDIMEDRPITVGPLESQTEVARLVAKYNLLEVPVVDENGVLHGIVTVDDAIDAIIPTAWKKHLPRFY
ncbi:MAG: magnesium transporter [Chloroflexi bacterium]|nr:magnesium transporter [Chloroflexota bacterium]